MNKSFSVYITTNPKKTVLYVGRTEDLGQRLIEHWLNRGDKDTFAGKYYCYNLIYWESTKYVLNSIEREKQLKNWSRKKKLKLIEGFNPNWKFLNQDILDWPPQEPFHRKDIIS